MNRHHHGLNLRARYRAFHLRHGVLCAKVGRAGIFGEMTYHGAELVGAHGGVLFAAAVLIVVYVARVAAGDL